MRRAAAVWSRRWAVNDVTARAAAQEEAQTFPGFCGTPFDAHYQNLFMASGKPVQDLVIEDTSHGQLAHTVLEVYSGVNKPKARYRMEIYDAELIAQAKLVVRKGSWVHVQGPLHLQLDAPTADQRVIIQAAVLVVPKPKSVAPFAQPSPAADTPGDITAPTPSAAPKPPSQQATPTALVSGSSAQPAAAASSSSAAQPAPGTAGQPHSSGSAVQVPSHVQVPDKDADIASLGVEALWAHALTHTQKWWDNRASKTNPKAPDYKPRDRAVDKALWIDSKNTPQWVKDQLLG